MNLYRRRSSTRNTRSLNNESRFHFFSSLLPRFFPFFLPSFLSLFFSSLWRFGGMDFIRVHRLTGGTRPRNDENSIGPILNRIPTDGYSYLDARF